MTLTRRTLLLSGAAVAVMGPVRRDPSTHCWLCGTRLLALPPVMVVCPNGACPVEDRTGLTLPELVASISERERARPVYPRLNLSPGERRAWGLQSMREQLNRLGGVNL